MKSPSEELHLAWGVVTFSLKCESGSSRFQPGEGPSRGLLRDYEPSDGTFWSTNVHHTMSPQERRTWSESPHTSLSSHKSPLVRDWKFMFHSCLILRSPSSHWVPIIFAVPCLPVSPLVNTSHYMGDDCSCSWPQMQMEMMLLQIYLFAIFLMKYIKDYKSCSCRWLCAEGNKGRIFE